MTKLKTSKAQIPNQREMLTPKEAARMLGSRLAYVYAEVWADKFPGARKLNGEWLIPAAVLRERILTRNKRKRRPREG